MATSTSDWCDEGYRLVIVTSKINITLGYHRTPLYVPYQLYYFTELLVSVNNSSKYLHRCKKSKQLHEYT